MNTLLLLALLAAPPVTVIHAGHLLPTGGEKLLAERTVVVAGDRIDRVVAGFQSPKDLGVPSADVIDLKAYTVLPGLIDSHVHILGELGPRSKLEDVSLSEADRAVAGTVYAHRTLLAGFTTIRDVGATEVNAVFAVRDAIARGMIPGPRLLVAGAILSPTGGHGQTHALRTEILDVIDSDGVCDGADDCRAAVRRQIRRGADHIKFVATGGVLSETAAGVGKQFFDDEMKAIVDTAHSLGRKVTAHAHGADGMKAALRAGVDSIEHASYADAEAIQLFKDTGAYLVPTLLAGDHVTTLANAPNSFLPPPIRDKAAAVGPVLLKNFGAVFRSGVKIAFGTDSGVSRHGDNARELLLMRDAGMPAGAVLASATVNAADHIGLQGIGRIAHGYYADMIAVPGKLQDDLRPLLSVPFVMKGGTVYKTLEP